jgi:Fungal trichothecene efflux pump (TRI12)
MVYLFRIDYLGTFLILGFVTFLLLGLQWGGNQKPWNDKGVIMMLVIAALLLILFSWWEYHLGPKRAMVPLDLLKRRGQVGCAAEAVCLFSICSYIEISLSCHFSSLSSLHSCWEHTMVRTRE